jgi:hypothetical protein
MWLDFRGVLPFIYSPGGWIQALGSNQLHVWLRCILGGGRRILQKLMVASHHRGRAAQGWGWPAPPGRLSSPTSVWSPLVSSETFLYIRYKIIPWYLLIFRPSLVIFCVNPAENINSPELMETISNNLLLYSIYPFWSFIKERLTVHGIL